jgi:hypothetical protein
MQIHQGRSLLLSRKSFQFKGWQPMSQGWLTDAGFAWHVLKLHAN